MVIRLGPFRTAADIRAAHTDSASGAIISPVNLQELAQTEEWHDLGQGGASFDVPCHHCARDGSACHFWNRQACLNCLQRMRCKGGVLKTDHVANPDQYAPQPLRALLLKELRDVLGSWAEQLGPTGGR